MSDLQQPPVTAYLTIRGGRDAIKLYKRAFGAKLLNCKMMDDDKRVQHAVLGVFGTMVMLSDEFPEYDPNMKSPKKLGGTTVTMHVEFDKPAKVNAAVKKAKAAGCKIVMPAMDTFWGMRYGRVTDPFGHAWAFGAALPAQAKG